MEQKNATVLYTLIHLPCEYTNEIYTVHDICIRKIQTYYRHIILYIQYMYMYIYTIYSCLPHFGSSPSVCGTCRPLSVSGLIGTPFLSASCCKATWHQVFPKISPKWMVKIMGKPYFLMDDFGGYHYFRKHPYLYIQYQSRTRYHRIMLQRCL